MNNIKISPSMLRLDTSRTAEYLYADRPKLSFGQKVGRFFGKTMSFLGPIGAAVTAIAVPGFGIPLAAGLYGLSKVSSDLTGRAQIKDAQKMQDYNQQVAGRSVELPGFFDAQVSQADIQTDFIAPSQFGPSLQNTIVSRESAIGQNLNTF